MCTFSNIYGMYLTVFVYVLDSAADFVIWNVTELDFTISFHSSNLISSSYHVTIAIYLFYV